MDSKLLLPVLLLFLIIQGCDNPAAITPGSQLPIITTGIVITNESSPETIAIWGNPSSISSLDIGASPNTDSSQVYITKLQLYTPYPNPSDGSQILPFSLPSPAEVKIWAETAYLPISSSANLPLGIDYSPPYQRVEIFDGVVSAGQISVNLNLKSKCRGGNMEQGFYRIFLLAENKYLFYRDIYIQGDPRLTPSGLEGKNQDFNTCEFN